MGKAGKSDILQGTLEVLILKTLSRGEMHGYTVSEWIFRTSGESLKVEEGALYPALHRLEARGLVSSVWGVSENNRRAKFYKLTRLGRRRLDESHASWRRTRNAIDQVLDSV
jgi:transcriptional regulator